MNIAILGGSHGGFATAADLALAGHSVRLWSRSRQTLGPLAADPTIALAAEGRGGKARLARATTELAEAVAGAEIVIAALPATSHDDLAKRLAPHVSEGQIILLTPGTLGSYAMARTLAALARRCPTPSRRRGRYRISRVRPGPQRCRRRCAPRICPSGSFPRRGARGRSPDWPSSFRPSARASTRWTPRSRTQGR